MDCGRLAERRKSKLKDIRLITLYKQHYLDQYSKPLQSEYSCWGYYDGMDIGEMQDMRLEKVSANHSVTPISQLWYMIGKKVEETTGQYGSINIGIFRCCEGAEADKRLEEFWNEKKKSIFFGAAFLQLENSMQYIQMCDMLEQNEQQKIDEDRKCKVLSYCTFDNADLVLLIQGNSLRSMEQKIRDIEGNKEVQYLHSILGVSEEYLQACGKKKMILQNWYQRTCFVDEKVARLDIRLVTSGEDSIIGMQKELLEKVNDTYDIRNFENIKYAYVSGHENWVISMENTDVRTMLAFLTPGGLATHQNDGYKKRDNNQGRLYNIETSYVLKYNEISEITSVNVEDEERTENKNLPHQWFRNRIEEYRGKLNVLLAEGNESLYSYYLALLRTVNSLVQYEEFLLSADIFYLLFPSFEMFEHKLKRVLELGKKVTPVEIEQAKKAVFEYVESVNSVIYHNIHTDQVYLMVPGYSGTSFSIPIKLNMAFLWLTDRVALIFGNTERKRKYRCILVPTMEAKPQTKRIEVESNPNDFLVCVKIPQRTLYMPEELMVILIHEMGHYIGGALRCRKERAKQLKKFVIDFLIDCMFKDVYEEEEDKKQNEIVKDGLKKQIENTIDHFFDDAKISEFYYGDQVVKVLRSACRYILSTSAELMKKSLENVTYNSFRDEKKIEKLIYAYSDLNYRINKNAKDILLWGIAEQKIYDEMEMYKECFSDLIAVKLLDISPEKLVAALNVSEGNTSQVPENQRRLVIQRVLNGGRPEDVEQMDYPNKYLYAYVASCQEWIEEKLGKCKREDLRAIRELYSAVTYNDESHFFDKAYAAILNCIQNMKSEIDEEIKENAS